MSANEQDLHQFLEGASAALRRFAERCSEKVELSEKLHELAHELEVLDQKLGDDDNDDSESSGTSGCGCSTVEPARTSLFSLF